MGVAATAQPRVAFYTLGCKLNFSETSTLARSLVQEGYTKVEFETEADVYVINTCSVTENADSALNLLLRLHTKPIRMPTSSRWDAMPN